MKRGFNFYSLFSSDLIIHLLRVGSECKEIFSLLCLHNPFVVFFCILHKFKPVFQCKGVLKACISKKVQTRNNINLTVQLGGGGDRILKRQCNKRRSLTVG